MARGPSTWQKCWSHGEHDLRSSYDNLLVVPATDSVTYGDRAFSVLGLSVEQFAKKDSSNLSRVRRNIISSKYFPLNSVRM